MANRPANRPLTLAVAKSAVRPIVDGLHVGTTHRGVISEVRDRFSESFRETRTPEARARRRTLYRAALLVHYGNRGLFDSLYGGGASSLEEEITTTLYGSDRR